MRRNFKNIFIASCFAFLSLFCVLSCEPDSPDPGNNYKTPTAKGSIVLPDDSGLVYSDIYIQVAPTGAQYRVNSDGTWVIPNLTDIDGGYKLFFQNGPFSTGIRSLDKENDNGNHFGAFKDHVTGSTGSGNDIGVIPIKKTGSFSGLVTLKDIKPYETNMDITVFIPGTSFMATPDEEGKYVLSGVPEGEYRLGFKANGYVTTMTAAMEMKISDDSENIVSVPDVELISASGSIKGYVSIPGSYATTDVEPNVSIAIINQDKPEVSYIAPLQDGVFIKSGVEPGIYRIEIGLEGYVSVIKGDILVSEASLCEIAEPFNLIPNGGSIKGQVKLQYGSDFSGISVLAINRDGLTYSTTTDREGVFSFDKCVPGKYEVLFAKSDYGSGSVETSVSVGQDAPYIIYELTSSTGSIIGVVSLSDGKSPNAIDITAKHESGLIKTAITDSNGNYYFEKCMPGGYTITFSRDGYTVAMVENVFVSDGEVTSVDKMLMKNTGSIQGQLFFPDENIPVSISIIATHESGKSYSALIKSDGSYIIEDCPVGIYEIEVRIDGFFSQMQSTAVVEMQTSQLDFSMKRSTGGLSGHLMFGDNAIPSAIVVSLADVSNPDNIMTSVADASGYFSFSGCRPGTYELTVTAKDYYAVSEKVTLVAGETTVLEKDMCIAIGSLAGVVSLSDSIDCSGVAITLTPDGDGEMKYALTDSLGRYSINSLPAGLYDVTFSKSGYVTASDKLLVIAGNSHEINMQLTKSLGVITGYVRLAGSSDYSGVTVTAKMLGGKGTSYTETTALDGLFNITDIKDEGLYQIIVSKTGYESNSTIQTYVKFSSISVVDTVELRNISGTVSGKISLEGTGNYENVSVILTRTEENEVYQSTVTNQEGMFTFRNVAPAEYSVTAMKDGYVSKSSTDFTVEKSQDFVLDEMFLAIGSRSVVGRVSLELAEDNSGILVTATDLSNPTSIYSAITNSAGDYSLVELKPGKYRITYSMNNYGTYTISEVDVVADSLMNIDPVELSINRGNIIGMVVLEGRIDHSGIKVTLVETGETTLTGSDGLYSFSVPAGNYPGGVLFEKEDFATSADPGTITVLTGSSYGVQNIELKATHTAISGQVDVKGTDDESGVIITIANTSFSYITDNDGSFLFEHVPIDRGSYVLSFEKENAPILTKDVTVRPSAVVDAGTVTITPNSATIYGSVSLDGMTNHENIKVSAISNESGAKILSTTTDAGGAFRLGNILTTGVYTITFEKAGWDSQSFDVSGLIPLEERDITAEHKVVLVDTTAPTLESVIIEGGANATSNSVVDIKIDAYDEGSGIAAMKISWLDDFSMSEWQNYISRFDSEIPNKLNGSKKIMVKVRDASGNESQGYVYDTIELVDQIRTVSGTLTSQEDLHWVAEYNPYVVAGTIIIPEGRNLVIDPGVDVLFNGDYAIVVRGTLTAIGSEDEKINFRSSSSLMPEGLDGYYGFWGGITAGTNNLKVKQDGYRFALEEGSILSNCVIADVGGGLSGNLFVTDCVIDSDEYALGSNVYDETSGSNIDNRFTGYMIDSEVRGQINAKDCILFGNKIASNGYSGYVDYGISMDYAKLVVNNYFSNFDNIYIWYVNGPLLFNTFDGCSFSDSGIRFYDEIKVSNNEFINMDKTLVLETYTFNKMNFSNIYSNTANPEIKVKTSWNNKSSHDWRYNYWGSAHTAELHSLESIGKFDASFIYDSYDNYQVASVDWSGFVDEPWSFAGYQGDDLTDIDVEFIPSFGTEQAAKVGESISFTISMLTDGEVAKYRVANTLDELLEKDWKYYGSSAIMPSEEIDMDLVDDNGRVNLVVQAMDTDGNVSPFSILSVGYSVPKITKLPFEDGSIFRSDNRISCYFDYVGTTGGYNLYFYLDGESHENSFETSDLKNGNHTLKIVVTDTVGNETEEVLSFVIDRPLPMVDSLTLEEGYVLEEGSSLDFDVKVVNAKHLKTMKIYSNDNLMATYSFADDGTYTVSKAVSIRSEYIPNGNNSLVVELEDYAGNITKSDPVSFSVSGEPVPPSIFNIGIEDNQVFTEKTIIELNPTFTDANGVKSVTVMLGDYKVYSVSYPIYSSELKEISPEIYFRIPYYKNGAYDLVVTASDFAGNTSSEVIPVKIDYSIPSVGFEVVEDQDGYRFDISADNAEYLKDVQLLLDGKQLYYWFENRTGDGLDWSSSWSITYPYLPAGNHEVCVVLRDQAGNEVFSESEAINVVRLVDDTMYGLGKTWREDGGLLADEYTRYLWNFDDSDQPLKDVASNCIPYSHRGEAVAEGLGGYAMEDLYFDFSESIPFYNSSWTIEFWHRNESKDSSSGLNLQLSGIVDGLGINKNGSNSTSYVYANCLYSTPSSGEVDNVYINLYDFSRDFMEEWHHYALVSNGNEYMLYVDGILYCKESGKISPEMATHMYLNLAEDSYIDELRVSGRARSYDELFAYVEFAEERIK